MAYHTAFSVHTLTTPDHTHQSVHPFLCARYYIMDRHHLNPRLQLQEASDTEMTPPCPRFERTNPFDDLAPPGTITPPIDDSLGIDPHQRDPKRSDIQGKGTPGGTDASPGELENSRKGVTVSIRS
jgi:hypothetical protein